MRTPLIILIITAFILTSIVNPAVGAIRESPLYLPVPGTMVHLSPAFNPPVLKGIKVHPDNPFRFDFILDKGDSDAGDSNVGNRHAYSIQDESTKLIKYFLASLTVPEKDLWVNLSPYEKDRIVPEAFGQTEMGRDLLAQDYMLKQITASLIYPEDEIGKKFWKRIYEEAAKKFGTTNIPVNTFNKVWIVPEKAVVYENAKAGTAYVVESKLKVMLETDYLAESKLSARGGSALGGKVMLEEDYLASKKNNVEMQNLASLSKQIIQEIIIPELTKEINQGKNFAQLRQVYQSLILATWYKKKIKDSILSQVYTDKNKVAGVNINDPQEKEKIYQQYLKAFKKGVYNYIKEDVDPVTQETIPRKHSSGGLDMAMTSSKYGFKVPFETVEDSAQILQGSLPDNAILVEVRVEPSDHLLKVMSQRDNQLFAVVDNSMSIERRISRIVQRSVAGLNSGGFKIEDVQSIEWQRVDRASISTGKVGKMIPGSLLKSQNEYNRDADIKEKFLKGKDVVDRFIAPGREGFQQFQPVYDEVRSIIDRLLIAQGLNPKEFQFFLADTVDPNAYIISHYNAIVVNLGLIQMLAEYAKANNIDVTQDALAWVLAHEIQHIMQDRREIDDGRIDEKKGLVDSHAEDRGKEYQSDLLALWLMDRGGFTVKTATHIFEGINHWLKTRGQKSAVWGTHPQIEERLRKLEHHILTYHWQNQDAQASALKSVSDSHKRTDFRQFQERVINVASATDLVSLLKQATSIDELLFAMLIGFEVLPDTEKQFQSPIQVAFEQQIRQFVGQNEAKRVLFEYMRDEVYVMLGLMRDDLTGRLDSFRRLGEQLSVETIHKIYELGVPNLFSLSIDVDKLRRNKRHEQVQGILDRLNTYSITMGGPTRASDRFKAYASGFLYGLYTKMIKDTQQGRLTLQEARRFLTDLVDMQDSQGYFKGYLFTTPLGDTASALSSSKIYRGQLEAEDIKLLLHVYEILGTKVNYALEADGLAKSLYELARNTTPEAKRELMDWLVRREDGWNSLRAEFIKLDIEALFKEGQGIVFQGSRMEYLDSLLANKNIVRNMQNVLKSFVEAMHKSANNVSPEDLVVMHQKIFAKLREEHINSDFGIFRDLWFMTRGNAQMFAGDAFERILSENMPAELQPLLKKTRRDLRPIFYIIALGGIPEDKDLRDFIFGALRVREKTGSMLLDPEIIALIKNAKLEHTVYDEEDLSERYNALSDEDKKSIRNHWNQVNPERRIENVNNDEFTLIRDFLERYRHSMGTLLAEKDSTPEQQEEAFGKYTAPIYLQALFSELGYSVRLDERDVGYGGSNAWGLFVGDIAHKGMSKESELVELAAKQRPRNVVRFLSKEKTFEDFVRLFDFILLLPQRFEDAIGVVLKEMPPSVFRNFVLHMIFVNRILIKETGYASDYNSLFDMRKMQLHIAGLSPDQRARMLSAIAVIAPHLVHDGIMERSNKMSVTNYWMERYTKNAPKLDETGIRREHGQEIGRYDDLTYATPGGSIAQLLVFVSRLADGEIEEALKDTQSSLSSKREMIERYYPQSSSARDRWIKATILAEGTGKTVEEIEKLLAMIYNHEMRDNLALGALDQCRAEHPGDFEFLSDALDKIKRFFPEASLIRDDVLAETAQYLAKTREQYEEVRKLYLDPFKKTKDLDLKETARTAMNQDIFRGWMTNRSPTEKAHFLLWLMGVTDEKPLFLVDFEYNFHVNADSLREDFGRRQSQFYALAGQSSQREALEPFLYGEKGIFNDGTAMANLLNGMFDFLIKDGPNKTVLKRVFDKVFAKADQSRREEVFLSLVWTLSLQRGEAKNGQQNISPEKQEARAVRMFLESLGLVGRQLAQVLARSLWVTQIMRDELALVQDNARKMDKGVVFDMLEKFGISGEFESIEEPLGSAKIAGVYRAKKKDDQIVAIKVKRPEVDKTVEADMKFLKDVFDDDIKAAFMAEGIIIPDNLITQIEEGFRQELDFQQEAKNTTELGVRVQRSVVKKLKEFSLRKLFGDTRLGEVQGDYEFYVPQIIDVVNNSVIIMEYIDGMKLSSERRTQEAGLSQSDIELAVANELLREVFYEGFYHGDPHLGNILIQKGENGRVRIILIDAGASFLINKTNRRMLGKLMVGVRDNDIGALENVVTSLGGAFNGNIQTELSSKVLGSTDSVGQKLLWFFHVLEKNHVAMPNEFLQIMRFFATGQALFDRGDSAMINEVEKIQAVDLDRAINQGSDDVAKRGGIDLTSDKALQVQNNGEAIKFKIDPAIVQQLQNAPGFVPVIINIQPMPNLRAFLGLKEEENAAVG